MSNLTASVDQLTKVYAKLGSTVAVHALRGISLDFVEGESVAICGQSGSGKSTLMNVLGCLDRPTTGRYLLGGQDVSHLNDDELSDLRGRRLGFIFQNFNLIPQMTVIENVEVPLFYQSVPPHTRHERASRLIELVDLTDRAHHRPMELSGGQQQRVAIARALVNDPILILADEPTGNLDSATGEMILAIFEDLRREGKTIFLVTHDQAVAARCDRIIVLRDGLVIQDDRSQAGNGFAGGDVRTTV